MNENGDNYFRSMQYFHKTYRKFCQQAVEEYHFTPGEVDVMAFLSNNPGMNTAADICRFKNISKPLVCRSVEALARDGFLHPVTDERDRRVIHLHLTAKADQISGRLRRCRADFFRQLMDGISAEQFAAFEAVLYRMQENLYQLLSSDCRMNTEDIHNQCTQKEGNHHE